MGRQYIVLACGLMFELDNGAQKTSRASYNKH